MTAVFVAVDVTPEVDGSALFTAVARENDDNGDILATETVQVPVSARKRFGDQFLAKDVEDTVRDRLATTLLSEQSLEQDWTRLEEDEAWSHLQ